MIRPSPTAITSNGQQASLWSNTAPAGTYTKFQTVVRWQKHRWLRATPHNSLEGTFTISNWIDLGLIGGIAQLEGVPITCFGDSYSNNNNGYSAPASSAFPYRVGSHNSTQALTNNGVAGTRSDQVLMNQVLTNWIAGPGNTGLIILSDIVLNDVNQYGASTQQATTAAAFQTILARLSSQASNAIGSSAFFFGPGWAAGASATAGSYVDFAWTGDGACLLVNFVTGAGGTLTIKNTAGVTVATVSTGGYAQNFTGSVKLTGFGAGTHTLRATLTTGTVTIAGLEVLSAAPPLIAWFVPGGLGPQYNATQNLWLPAYTTACKTVAAGWANCLPVLTDSNFNAATMLDTTDGVHPNDLGNTYIADLFDQALWTYLQNNFPQGLNSIEIQPAYTTPAPSYTSPAATAPAQVTGMTATTGYQAVLSWSEPTDGGSELTGYQLQSSTDNATWSALATVANNVLSYTVAAGLTQGSTYYFRVAAINAIGTGTYSTSASCTAGAVPTVYASDTFQRANNSSLGSTPVGNYAWATLGTTWSILNNALNVANSTTSTNNDCTINDGQANGTFTAILPAVLGLGILFDAAGTNNATGYVLYPTTGGYYRLSKRTSTNNYTALVTSTTIAAAGDVVSVIKNGSTITVKVNGAVIINTTDASYSGTVHGIWAANTGISGSVGEFIHTNATS
jgi:hypothetical protein